MTPTEFKAWFEGFTETLEDVPTEVQWKRIKERVAEIDGKQVTEQHFVTHYYPHYPHYHFYPLYGTTFVPCGTQTTCGTVLSSVGQNHSHAQGLYNGQNQFSSLTAMNALGRAEAATLTS